MLIQLDEFYAKAFVLNGLDAVDSMTSLTPFAAVITRSSHVFDILRVNNVRAVLVPSSDEYQEGHVIAVQSETGFIRILYRPESPHNTIFTTDRCNSNCIMCSQPPKEIDDSYLVEENLRMISLIRETPETMGITGGEPTLLGSGLFQLVEALKTTLPVTHVQMLTNGRNYRNISFPRRLAQVGHPSFVSAIPLYADVPMVHDYIVQAKGAFDETLQGFYNAAEVGLALEVRVVLHKQSIPRLKQLAEFIYCNLPFAIHVVFMGLEHMGYVKKNWEDLWIDPVEYMATL